MGYYGTKKEILGRLEKELPEDSVVGMVIISEQDVEDRLGGYDPEFLETLGLSHGTDKRGEFVRKVVDWAITSLDHNYAGDEIGYFLSRELDSLEGAEP